MKKAIFAGSFDPLHQGHLKIICKGAKLFDYLFVIVANNEFKPNQTNLEVRLAKIKEQINLPNVKIISLKQKYLAEFAKSENIKYLIRSARNDTDFNYELEMAKVNQTINKELETILIIPDYQDINLRSSEFRNLQKNFLKEQK